MATEKKPEFRPIVSLDFDGTIHSYEHGWQGGVIYGTLTPGFVEWAISVSRRCQLVIYSSRSATEEGVAAMKAWLERQLAERMMPHEADEFIALFTFASEKPAAWVSIDDRAIQFQGDWTDPDLSLGGIMRFRPWMNRKKVEG